MNFLADPTVGHTDTLLAGSLAMGLCCILSVQYVASGFYSSGICIIIMFLIDKLYLDYLMNNDSYYTIIHI